jgi:hypothetical protein
MALIVIGVSRQKKRHHAPVMQSLQDGLRTPPLAVDPGLVQRLPMVPKSPLDNPETAAIAWGRFRRLVTWMVSISFVAVVCGLGALRWIVGPIPLHMIIATSLGIFASVLLGTVLMSLIFLSNGSGHDAAILNPFEEEDPQ